VSGESVCMNGLCGCLTDSECDAWEPGWVCRGAASEQPDAGPDARPDVGVPDARPDAGGVFDPGPDAGVPDVPGPAGTPGLCGPTGGFQNPCTTDNDCLVIDTRLKCLGSVCVLCTADSDCASNAVCNSQHMCDLRCQNDGDCKSRGTYCLGGICGCFEDFECYTSPDDHSWSCRK
jgi:hypothetical protein